jgi:hypothetical protein
VSTLANLLVSATGGRRQLEANILAFPVREGKMATRPPKRQGIYFQSERYNTLCRCGGLYLKGRAEMIAPAKGRVDSLPLLRVR